MRRVKKTTFEQFDLLKSEMALHPAAARGYGVGAQRVVVDAEWKDIVEKLNALGPPERTMTEWKKVWSDLRLRSIKRLSDEFTPKPKKVKYKSKKNKLLEHLNSSESIYASCGVNSTERSFHSPTNNNNESHNVAENTFENNPLDGETETELHNTEKHFLNSCHDTSSFDINSFADEEDIYHNNSKNFIRDCPSPLNRIQAQVNDDKINYFSETLSTLERQMRNQNIIMEHLAKITSNLAELMERHVTSLEKQNNIMERQMLATEYHNTFLKQEEAKRKDNTENKEKCEQNS